MSPSIRAKSRLPTSAPDDREVEEVGQREVVEADQSHRMPFRALAERLDSSDGDGVAGGEDRRGWLR